MAMFSSSIPVLILAAGASRRMGRAKQLMPWGAGILMDQAIRQARMVSSCVIVVAGAHYPLVRYRSRCALPRWVYTPDWTLGMSASLQAGLQSLPPGCPGVFVMLADQPLLSAEGLHTLAAEAHACPGQVLAADYDGRPGAPAYLPRALWPEVMALEGDQGASGVLCRHRARRIGVGGVWDDVDTPADWQGLKRP